MTATQPVTRGEIELIREFVGCFRGYEPRRPFQASTIATSLAVLQCRARIQFVLDDLCAAGLLELDSPSDQDLAEERWYRETSLLNGPALTSVPAVEAGARRFRVCTPRKASSAKKCHTGRRQGPSDAAG